ncbi:phospholipase b-related [Anaeramoeba flamelloides]|uniref:Phospholipase B-like n=1 Tax=Anaeramoeba flamelloides TaxID=1746091 RepID=A0AAV7ZDI7_9EUKA|nr:phospholipase b-related [Anaeramoeba flamelloides]
MNKALSLFLICFLFLLPSLCAKKYGTVYYDKQTQEYSYAATLDVRGVATGMESDEVEQDGWEKVSLRTSTSIVYSDSVKAYGIGLLEGILTRDRVVQVWANWLEYTFPKGIPQDLIDFIEENIKWMKTQTAANPDDQLWKSLDATLKQIEGIADGVNWKGDSGLTLQNIYILNVMGDTDDILSHLQLPGHDPKSKLGYLDHCSGLIKLAEDGSDIYTSQVTWERWYSMLRQLKYYEFHFNDIPSADIVFSGYGGVIVSQDDYYQVDKSRIIIETTMIVFNTDIYKYVTSESLLSTYRTMVCNRNAKNGKDWADCYSQYNSGTYNNDWLVVDYLKWEESSKSDIVWCCEQMPGKILCDDITSTLLQDKYIPTYNIPRFAEIFNYSGYDGAVKKYGSWFDFELHPRAQIFRRNQSSIKNMEHMKAMMRYNNWEHDPLSNGSPGNAISSRKDLIDPNKTQPNPFLLSSCFGGLDAKIGGYADLKKSQINAQMGPTHDQQPVFSWSNAPKCCDGVPHKGQPDTFDFDWIVWAHQM